MWQQNIRTTLWLLVVALASTSSAEPKHATQVGYVYCAPNQSGHLTPVFLDPCVKSPVGNLSCGQKLEASAGSGAWLKIVIGDGVTRWVSGIAISQTGDKFIPVNIQAGPAPECKVPQRDPANNHGPRAIYAPDPDFPASPHSS